MPRVGPVCGRPDYKSLAPDRFCDRLYCSCCFLLSALGITPARAQGIELLRDTETEDMLKSYEAPLAKAAGLDPERSGCGWWAIRK